MTTMTIWTRLTSTSSNNRVQRGLFWSLIGAGLVREVWRWFWKWVLPPKKRSAEVQGLLNIMKSYYLEPLKEQLKQETSVLVSIGSTIDKEVKGAVDDYRMDALRYMISSPKPPPLTKGERRKLKFKRWIKGFKPVIMTQKQKEELEYYD